MEKVACLMIPNLPSLAVGVALGVAGGVASGGSRRRVVVHERGVVVSPLPLKGVPVEKAVAMVPDALFTARHHALEQAAWEGAVEEVFRITPLLEDHAQPDPCMGEILFSPDDSDAVRRIVNRTEAQCGIARTPVLASLAAQTASPGAIRVVDEDDEGDFVAGYKLQALGVKLHALGVRLQASGVKLQASGSQHKAYSLTPKAYSIFELLGLSTLGSLLPLTRSQLASRFGELGEQIHDVLSHLFTERVLAPYTPKPEVVEQERFSDATNEPQMVLHAMERCIERACAVLQKQRAQRMEVMLLDAADAPHTSDARILRMPVNEPRILRTQAHAMLERMCTRSMMSWGVRLRLASLSVPRAEQTTLFSSGQSAVTAGGSNGSRQTADGSVVLSEKTRRYFLTINIIDPNAYCADMFATLQPRR